MKKLLIVLLAAGSVAACKTGDKKMTDAEITKRTKDSITAALNGTTPANGQATDPAENTTIQWMDSTYLDLGQQKEGKEIEISFRFKNTGDKNLVIQGVTAQCGCTIPEKPEQPFAPGEEGVIKAKFNGSGHDETRKQIYVTANTSPSQNHTLEFRAQLIK